MNIQIIGTKRCNDTKKAMRFFKERSVKFHFLDLAERELSPGELQNIVEALSPEEIIDRESKAYKKKGLAYMEFDIIEEILENNMLLKTPVVRNGKMAAIGDRIDIWKEWLKGGR